MIKQKYLDSVQAGVVLNKAWSDPEFKERVERDPTHTLREFARMEFDIDLERPIQVGSPPDDLTIERLHAAPASAGIGTVAFTGAFLTYTKSHKTKGSSDE